MVLRIGPRLVYGSNEYADTYFGITPEESAASGLDAYDPGAGLTSAGFEAVATYQLTERWWLEGGAKWKQFKGDAANSPIVENGSNDYTEFRIGFRRLFTLRL